MVKPKPKKNGRTKRDLILDIGLAILFVIMMEVYFTGIPLHEWLGLLFAALFTVHIIWHWRWIVSITKTFFKKVLHESRLNYVLNTALLADMALLTVSGIVISHSLGFQLSLSSSAFLIWQTIHALTAQLSLILIALHIGLHWRWILTNTRKYLFSRPQMVQPPRRPLSPIPVRLERRESHE
jgi:hypothetical protein